MRPIYTAPLTGLLLAGLFALPAVAGWVETHAEGNVIVYAHGKIKEMNPEEPTWSVVDMDSQSLLLVHEERQLYAHGPIDDFCHTMETYLKASMAAMSPEERALMDRIMGKDQRRTGKRPLVTIGKTGDGGTISELNTEKYMVLVDGKLYEELWLAPEAPVNKELDAAAVRNLEKKMTACMENIAEQVTGTWLTLPEQDPDYQQLLKRGWLMRRISYNDGLALTEMVVTGLELKTVSATEFQPPRGFRKISWAEFLFED